MDAMSTFGNVEYPWNVHCRNSFVCMALCLGSAGMGRGAKGFGDEFADCRDVARVFIADQHVKLPWPELFRGLPDFGVFKSESGDGWVPLTPNKPFDGPPDSPTAAKPP